MYCCNLKSEFRKPDLQPALNTFLDPCPIKDTDINTSSINETGVSNIDNIIKETGKVTAVVAVMQLTSNPIKDRQIGKKQYSKTVLMTKSVSRSTKKRPALKTKLIRVLLDTGSSDDLIFTKKGSRPNITIRRKKGGPRSWTTSNGTFTTSKVGLVDLTFLDFSQNKKVHLTPDIVEYQGEAPKFDLILGKKTMHELGIVLDCQNNTVTIDSICLPMRNIDSLLTKHKSKLAIQNYIAAGEPLSTASEQERADRILDAKYEKADLPDIVRQCKHLNLSERDELLTVLRRHETLFDGTLGIWKLKPVSFELREGSVPYSTRPYPIPELYFETTPKEIDRLCEIGVLKRQRDSEWGSPTFITPKKDQTVRVVSDFRRLNSMLVRKPFPLPKISTTLQQLKGFTYATALDLNMGYYHIRIDAKAQDMCTIIFPWGKYSYQRLPMGICGAPDIFQGCMSELMEDLMYVRAYLDDLLIITSGSLSEHLAKLDIVLSRLRDAGLKVNALKSFFCTEETEYLGYILTRDGIKPQPQKVQAILALNPPKMSRSFSNIRDIKGEHSEMLLG